MSSDLVITASAGFISPQNEPNTFIMVKNKRGWDIPGGHSLPGETPYQTMERELLEETSCRLIGEAQEIVTISGDFVSPGTGIAIFRGFCRVVPFEPNNEIFDRMLVSRKELVKNYFGDKTLIASLSALI